MKPIAHAFLMVLAAFWFSGHLAHAADWVQIASEPDIGSATARASGFTSTHRDVRVFATTSGWFAIVLGPAEGFDLDAALTRFKRSGSIPRDSFVTDGETYLRQVWSSGSPSSDMARIDAVKRESTWSEQTRMGVQNALIWSGDYRGRIDGDFGRLTREAVMGFQNRLGHTPTGYLTQAEIAELESRRVSAQQRAGYRVVDDYQSGIRVGLAQNLFHREQQDGVIVPFSTVDGRARMMLISMRGDEDALAALHEVILKSAFEIPGREEIYQPYRDTWFVVSKSGFSETLYAYVRIEHGAAKGFLIRWDNDASLIYGPIATAMFNDFETIPGMVLDPDKAPVAEASAQPPKTRRPEPRAEEPQDGSTGSGFYVSPNGHVLTNHHVIYGCSSILAGGLPARVMADNPEDDLALLQVSTRRSPPVFAKFSPRPARLNADVTALGFPLHGLLGGLNVTRGVVSGLSGIGGNRSVVQISAEVQPGNSGGPLLDMQGAVVGVVVAKLDALVVAKLSGDVPQNVNFAVRGELAKTFLSRNMVDFDIQMSSNLIQSSDLAETASTYTVLIECAP